MFAVAFNVYMIGAKPAVFQLNENVSFNPFFASVSVKVVVFIGVSS